MPRYASQEQEWLLLQRRLRTVSVLFVLMARSKFAPKLPTICSNPQQNELSANDCQDVTLCDAVDYALILPTSSSDTQCAPLRNCNLDEFESRQPTYSTNRECVSLRTCMPGTSSSKLSHVSDAGQEHSSKRIIRQRLIDFACLAQLTASQLQIIAFHVK